jgi:hypothetical protein
MQTKRKLSLSKETLRNLQPTEMGMVAGGGEITGIITVTLWISDHLGCVDTNGCGTTATGTGYDTGTTSA